MRAACEQRKDTYWDSKACECTSKSIAPRGVDSQHEERRPCDGEPTSSSEARPVAGEGP